MLNKPRNYKIISLLIKIFFYLAKQIILDDVFRPLQFGIFSISEVIKCFLILKEMFVPFTSLGRATIKVNKQPENDEGWQGAGGTGTLVHCWQECKTVQTLWIHCGESSDSSTWSHGVQRSSAGTASTHCKNIPVKQ